MDIDPIHQWSGQAISIFLYLRGCASTFTAQISEMSAGTGIHCCNEHKLAWKCKRSRGPRDRDSSILERLAHYFQSASMKCREFVQEKNSVMGETDFPRSRLSGSSQQTGVRNRVMGTAKRPSCDEAMLIVE